MKAGYSDERTDATARSPDCVASRNSTDAAAASAPTITPLALETSRGTQLCRMTTARPMTAGIELASAIASGATPAESGTCPSAENMSPNPSPARSPSTTPLPSRDGLPSHGGLIIGGRDEPDRRQREPDADPGEQRRPLAGDDAHEHRQQRGPDRRERRDDAHASGREAAVEERRARAGADARERSPSQVGRRRTAAAHHGRHTHEHQCRDLGHERQRPYRCPPRQEAPQEVR